jgi:hypothetical protein
MDYIIKVFGIILSEQIDWQKMEFEFKNLYSEQGRPSIAIRKIAGLLMLKAMFNESDELQSKSRNPKFK